MCSVQGQTYSFERIASRIVAKSRLSERAMRAEILNEWELDEFSWSESHQVQKRPSSYLLHNAA